MIGNLVSKEFSRQSRNRGVKLRFTPTIDHYCGDAKPIAQKHQNHFVFKFSNPCYVSKCVTFVSNISHSSNINLSHQNMHFHSTINTSHNQTPENRKSPTTLRHHLPYGQERSPSLLLIPSSKHSQRKQAVKTSITKNFSNSRTKTHSD